MKFTFPGYLTFLLLSPSILLKEEEISGPPNSLELLDLEPLFEKQEEQRLFFSVKCSPTSSQHASGNVCVEHVREKLNGTAFQCLSSQVRGHCFSFSHRHYFRETKDISQQSKLFRKCCLQFYLSQDSLVIFKQFCPVWGGGLINVY